MLFPARTLLACWLTVAATGAVVAHHHAPASGEPTGLGWASLAPTSAPACPLRHGHFLFLGIEFGETTGDPDTDGPEPSRVERVVDGVGSPHADGGVIPDTDRLAAGPGQVLTAAPRLAAPAPPSATSSCARAARTRTGVLRS